MNVASDNLRLMRSASETNINPTDIKSVRNRAKQQVSNRTDATTQRNKKTDSVQISETGAELSRASSASAGASTMEAYTDNRAEDKRVSAGSIESVMARYKEAQNFMAQIEFQSVNSTA